MLPERNILFGDTNIQYVAFNDEGQPNDIFLTDFNPYGTYDDLVKTIRARANEDFLFRGQLLATAGAYIIFDTYDTTGDSMWKNWGINEDGLGKNLMGKALMQVREEALQKKEFAPHSSEAEEFERTFNGQKTISRLHRDNLNKLSGQDLTGKPFQELVQISKTLAAKKKEMDLQDAEALKGTSALPKEIEAEESTLATEHPSITTRQNLHVKENREGLEDYLDHQFGEANWQVTERKGRDGTVTGYDYAIFSELESKKAKTERQPTYQFTAYSHNLGTKKRDEDTFYYMLETLKHVYGEKNFKPLINIRNEAARDAWIEALKQAGYTDKPEQYIHFVPKAGLKETDRSTMRPGKV